MKIAEIKIQRATATNNTVATQAFFVIIQSCAGKSY
jgi:hypothetical protein